jgi:hypothetical protein
MHILLSYYRATRQLPKSNLFECIPTPVVLLEACIMHHAIIVQMYTAIAAANHYIIVVYYSN